MELSPELFLLSRQNLASCPNTKLYLGSSDKIFPRIFRNITSPTLFYLDGHWSEQNTAKGKSTTPIINEITAIKAQKKTDAVILVDDVRLFQKSLRPERIHGTARDGYPLLNEVIKSILEINKGYQFCFLSDAMLAFPPNLAISVSPLVRACALQRLSTFYPDINNHLLRESATIISNAQNNELEDLDLYHMYNTPSEFEDGYFCYSALWYGLTLMNTDQEQDGISLIRQVFENCLPDYKPELLLGDFYGKVFPEHMELSSL